MSTTFQHTGAPHHIPTPGSVPRVALFATCLADRFFATACADAVHVLRHFGVEVDVPKEQTCCGQPAYNTGHRDEARRMARHTARTFAGSDYVVLPSGSCAGMIRSFYGPLLTEGGGRSAGGEEETGMSAQARARAARPLPDRTFELSEFLVRVLGVTRSGPDGSPTVIGTGLAGRRLVYHHGCHALRELGVRDEPVALLRACGADVSAWEGDTECCGFGGLFSTKFPQVSAGMADRKLDALPAGVHAVTSADGGCLLQLSGRARRRGGADGPPFIHLATLLREGIST
jgi:L-lactate dehydrogenase complex protein LldE